MSRDADPDDSLFIQEMELYHHASAYKCIRKSYAGKEHMLIAVACGVADQLMKNNGDKPTLRKVVAAIARKS